MERGRLTAFVERNQLTWELGMGALAVVYLVVSFMADEGQGPSALLIGVLAAVFLGEFFARLWDARSRSKYLRQHWIDLVSAIPLVGGLRAIRLVRLFRLGAAARVFTAAQHDAQLRGRDRDSFWMLGPALVVLWVVSAAAYWELERGINANVHNFGDALYWSFITATTVGYGDIKPVTPEGRILAGALIFVGIGLVGFASAQLTQRWFGHQSRDPILSKQMASMEAEMRQVRELLGQIAESIPGADKQAK